MKFNDQKITHIETSQVKEGVVCDVYKFQNDDTKDLGIIKVLKGFKTPLQKVLLGDKTIEIFREGAGQLIVTCANREERVYKFPEQQSEVEVKVGEIMQWEAFEDLTFAEVCYPPYKEGRFVNLDEEL